MPNDVVRNGDVVNNGPRHSVYFCADRKDECRTPLIGTDPVVLENVSIYGDSLAALQFQMVFDQYRDTGIRRIAWLPAEWLEKVIILDENVRRDDTVDGRNRATESHRLRSRFQVIVDDLIRSGTVPPAQCLGILPGARKG